MPILHSLGRRLDRRRWLGFSIWAFALGSPNQPYGRLFLRRAVLRCPLAVLRGLLTHRRFLAQGNTWGRLTLVGVAEEEAIWSSAARAGPRFLVGVRFCQKPGGLGGRGLACPSGRFIHRCSLLEQVDVAYPESRHRTGPASSAALGLWASALHAGVSLYIMTSALDIAEGFLLPALAEGCFAATLLTLCPYSVEPMALSLLICGLKAAIAPYEQGACVDFGQWLHADRGISGSVRICLPRPRGECWRGWSR